MIPFNIDYEGAIDFGHCESMNEASAKLSELTNILNKVISIRHYARKFILESCSKHPSEKMHKLSFDNKIVCLLSASNNDEEIGKVIDLFFKSDEAYVQIRLKHSQVIEDLMKLKKQADITPH